MFKKSKSTKLPKWQKEQENKKIKQTMAALRFLFFFALFLGIVFAGTLSLNQVKNAVWDGRSQINIIFQVDTQVFLTNFTPEQASLNVAILPEKTLIETAKGFGDYRVEKICDLGNLEKIGGGELLRLSMEQFFGLLIEGYIVQVQSSLRRQSYGASATKFKVISYKNDLKKFLISSFFGKGETNLTKWDLVRLFVSLPFLRQDQIEIFELEKRLALEKGKLPDGSEVFKVNQVKLNEIIQKNFFDPNLGEGEICWQVLNATNHLRLSASFARILQGSGLCIVSLEDASEKREETIIYLQEEGEEKQDAIKKIAKHFKTKLEFKKVPEAKAEVVVFLGEDYWRYCCQR